MRSSFTWSTGQDMLVDLSLGDHRPIFAGKSPRRFPSLNQAVNRSMHRCGDPNPLGLASDRPAQKIHLRRQLMTNVIEHRRRMVGHGADLVHLPRILVQLHSHDLSYTLAFVEPMV